MRLGNIKPYDKLPFHGVILPDISILSEHKKEVGAAQNCTNAQFLRELCRSGFRKRFPSLDPVKRKEYGERVNFELETIDTLGFTNYILMVWDICRFADENDIPRGPGRGSVGSSLVAYLVGITELDPISNGLFFSRFLSKARAKKILVDGVTYIDGGLVPDIDCDFSYYRRGEVIEYINNRYPGQTSKLLTTTTFTSKILIKDVLKSYEEADESHANSVSDLMDKKHGIPIELKDALSNDEKLENKKLKEWAKNHKETCDIAMGLSGLSRSEGQHASAVLVCHKDIRQLMPLQLSADKDLVSAFDMYSAQDVVIKMDILGLRTLDVIREVCRMIKIKPSDIDVHHRSIYAYLQNFVHRYGIFQLETFAQGNAAAKIKPKNFDHLAATLAVARPGAFAYLDQFVKYVNEGVYTPIDPLVDEVLKQTGGICLYQESLLAMVNKLGMDLDECEGLRRAIGKKEPEKIKEYKEKIYAVAKKNGHSIELADLIWKIAEDSGGYQFNKSHSCCYAMITAQTLYLKANYPLEFYLALLKMSRHEADGHQVISQIEKEMRARGFQLLPPHLVQSDMDFKIVDEKSIRFSLGMIRGVSDKSMSKMETFRSDSAKKQSSLFELFQAMKNAGLNIGIGSALIQAGCLEGFPAKRTRLVLQLCTWNLLSDKEKGICITIGDKPTVNWDVMNAIVYLRDNNDEKGKPLMKASRFETIKKKYQNYKEIYDLNRSNEALANFFYERTVLGYSFSQNVRTLFEDNLTGLKPIVEALQAIPDSEVSFIGFVKDAAKGKTKNGNDGFKMTVTDETAEVAVRFFNQKIKYIETKHGRLPDEDDLVVVRGTKKDGDVVFAESVGIQTAKIYMKLSELPDAAAKKHAKTQAESQTEAT